MTDQSSFGRTRTNDTGNAWQEAELFQGAEGTLKATKDKMKAVYHDLSSISPDAQKLLQRCAEN